MKAMNDLVQKIDALEKKITGLEAGQLPSQQAKAINYLLLKLKDASYKATNVTDMFQSSLPILREILNAISDDRGVDTDDGLLSRCYHLLQEDLSNLLETLKDSRDEYKGVKKYLKVRSHHERVNTIRATIDKVQVKYLRTASSIRGTVTTQRRTTTSVGTMTENTDVEFVSMVMPSSASGTTTGISEMEAIRVRDFLRSGKPCRDIETSVEIHATCLIDFLQQEVDDSIHLDDGDYRKRTTKCLLFVAKAHGVVPTSFSCPSVICQGRHPVWGGGFADIWKGQMNDETVCLKVLRIFLENGHVAREKIIKNFCSEALVWRNLNHPNVLPFLGVSKDLFYPSFCLISPWMNNGNIMAFLSQNPDHDRLRSVTEVAQGLAYLHTLAPPIVHADIRGANILVSDDLRCCLADFGLALAVESQAPVASTMTLQGSLRWLAPEILDVRLFDARYVAARDIYAFGCTILEIYTGKPPFSDIHSDAAIIHEVLTRCKMPCRPLENVFPSEGLWVLVQDCLAPSATERPSAHSILRVLQGIV